MTVPSAILHHRGQAALQALLSQVCLIRSLCQKIPSGQEQAITGRAA